MALPPTIKTAADAQAVEAALAADAKHAKLQAWDQQCAAKALAAVEAAITALGDVRPASEAGRRLSQYIGVLTGGIAPILKQVAAPPPPPAV